ncbi:MAG: LacI family DNA-binding transcriptional regulator [Lachnospiraceae bacterium]|nr:LacI family DNA-binding transcriptional regulator [Lachnospiraceae bacterium]
MTQKSSPTMKDVAREAGVSLGTVSNVINGITVRESSRRKVEEAIKKLNYQVNSYARGLKMSRTGTITLIIPTLNHPFFSELAYEIEQQAYMNSRKLILCCSNGIAEKELEYLSLATQNKTDGIIALTYSDISRQVPDNIPFVVFDRYFENQQIPRIASDNYTGGIMAVNKLYELGCRNIAFIGFHSSFPGEADKRFDGYMSACRQLKLTPCILHEPDDTPVDPAIRNFIEKNIDPKTGSTVFDGIFANTDYDACIVREVLESLNIRVPEQVQLIGFDGTKKFYAENEYYVSTICQPLKELARKCVEMVINESEEILPSLTLLPVHYASGGTTRD